MDIGTAKPTKREQRRVPHYMIDIISPRQTYSAWEFQQAVYTLVDKINRRSPGRPIFLVGGTYLYVDAVLKGWDFAEAKLMPTFRKKILKMTTGAMFRELQRLDPRTADKIDKHNRRRLLRALEAIHATGKSFYETRSATPPRWDILRFGMNVPQKKLDASNRRRIDRMFHAGWKKELARLIQKYPSSAPGFLAHGYREVLALIQSDHADDPAAVEKTKQRIAINTRHHAKRQRAWFIKDPETIWVNPKAVLLAQKKIKEFLDTKK